MDVLAIIPVRSGSKRIPHKNLRSVLGKPLMAHTIEQALAAEAVTRTVVSTDAEDYAEIARRYGAEAPFLRPDLLSEDDTPDLPVFAHALDWLFENEGYRPELVVHLRATHPVRRPEEIDEAVRLLAEHPEWDAVRSVVPTPHTPYKMWTSAPDGTLRPLLDDGPPESYNLPRQSLPVVLLQNASIDVTRTTTIQQKGSMTGDAIGAYVMDAMHDIDTPDDLARALRAVTQAEPLPRDKRFVIDIDGVIATLTPGNDYAQARAQPDTVAAVNALYDAGNEIILLTARGYVTGIDWRAETERQMAEWGVRYHELHFGKPNADFYVDDRMLSLPDLLAFA